MGYQLIETIEVGSGGAASIEFTSIPQDGVDLLVKFSGRSTNGANRIACTFNSGSFSWIYLLGNGSSASSNSGTNSSYVYLGDSDYTANTFGNTEIYIANYTSATDKSISVDAVNENNATEAIQVIHAVKASMSQSITSLTLSGSANLAQYSTASLYKITAD